MTTHPMHLFDPALKGLAGKPAQPVRLAPATQNDVSLNALLETATTKAVRRSPLEWAAATGLHFLILAALIIVPLYTTETIQLHSYENTPLLTPPAAPPPPPPAAGRAVAPHISSRRPNLTYTLGKVTAPASIPKTVSLDNAATAPDLEGVVGGVPGGVPGGNSAVHSAELLAGPGPPYRYRLRSGPQRSELFALVPASKHRGKPVRSNRTIRYSRSKSEFRALS